MHVLTQKEWGAHNTHTWHTHESVYRRHHARTSLESFSSLGLRNAKNYKRWSQQRNCLGFLYWTWNKIDFFFLFWVTLKKKKIRTDFRQFLGHHFPQMPSNTLAFQSHGTVAFTKASLCSPDYKPIFQKPHVNTGLWRVCSRQKAYNATSYNWIDSSNSSVGGKAAYDI